MGEANGTTVQTTGAALVRHEAPSPLVAIAPRNLDDVYKLATTAAKSGLYGVKSPEDGFIRMATGMELGLSPIQSLRGISVINGKPALGAELMIALCLQHPECEAFELVETTDAKATWRTVRRGKETKMSFTIEQARGAQLTGKDVWKAYPATMLRWRAASMLAKAVYPEKMMGLMSLEEAVSIRERGHAVVVDGDVVTVVTHAEPSRPQVAATPDGEIVEEPKSDPTLAEAARLEMAIRDAGTLDERDAAVKDIVKSAKGKRITPEQFEILKGLAEARKRELGGQ